MPDQIGDFRCLNKLQPPDAHGWELAKITRDFVDGDAWQKVARRAEETVHECAFFVATAANAKTLQGYLKELPATAGLTMICDGQTYDEIVVLRVTNIRIIPLQRHSKCIAVDGTIAAGGVGGRQVRATIVVGRSNQPV
jgi:hypothetical protein